MSTRTGTQSTGAAALMVAALLPGAACLDRFDPAVDCSETASAGLEGCACFPDGGCHEGLKCMSNVCVEPVLDPVGTAVGDDVEDDVGDDGSTTSGPCTLGAKGCGCVDGTCGLGLQCVQDVCVDDSGTTGDATVGDDSGNGDATVGDTTGGDGSCVEQHADPCYVGRELLDCCTPDLLCLGDETTNACEPACRTHSECPDCCAWAEGMLGKFCSPGSAWCGVLCIDTCGEFAQDGSWAPDGYCDDLGGLAGCEYGTDCTDCGPRIPKEVSQIVEPDALRVVDHEYRRRDNELRILFDQPIDLDAAGSLIAILDDGHDEVAIQLRRSRHRAFKGIEVPSEHLVIVSWKQRSDRVRDLQLYVAQDEMTDDYRATLPAMRRR